MLTDLTPVLAKQAFAGGGCILHIQKNHLSEA